MGRMMEFIYPDNATVTMQPGEENHNHRRDGHVVPRGVAVAIGGGEDKEEDLEIRFTEYVRRRVGRLRWAPLAYTSALEGLGVEKLLPLVDEVAAARAHRIPTAQLNVAFEKMLQRHEPAGGTAGAMPKYLTQVGVNPPSFVVFASGRGAMRADYRRYIENRLRDGFEFAGAPLRIKVRR
jgi:GTP-binding protein